MGVAWDEASGNIWFLQSGNGALVYFDPEEFADCETAGGDSFNDYVWEIDPNTGAVLQPMPTRYCSSLNDTRCFHRITLPNTTGVSLTANQLVVQQPGSPDAGAVWMTLFFNGQIARYDPGNGEFQRFPVHKGRTITDSMFSWFLRTHQILIHPEDGDLLLSANGSGQLIRFDLQAYLGQGEDGLCEQLTSSGRNPCMTAFEIPDVPTLTTHSVALDKFGNLWFTSWSGPTVCGQKARPPSVGFINRAWTEMIYFDHLRLEPHADKYGPGDAAVLECSKVGTIIAPWWAYMGITVDDNNDVWIANFYSKMVSRMSYKHPAWLDPYCAVRDCEKWAE
jgi:sugar lactone lactonase YvrE